MNFLEASIHIFSSLALFLIFSFESFTIGYLLLTKLSSFKELFSKSIFYISSFLFGWILFFSGHYAVCYVFFLVGWDGFWLCNFTASLGLVPCLYFWKNVGARPRVNFKDLFSSCNKTEVFMYSLLFFLIVFWMYFTFSEDDQFYYVGSLVWADFGPHLAMIRSFSRGLNFPTNYPHFAEDGIRYHFLFHYMVAVFERIGWKLSFSLNFFSSLGYMFFLIFFGYYSKILFQDRRVSVLSLSAFFLRGSLGFVAFFGTFYFWDYLSEYVHNREFFGLTPKENWGLFSFKVYINQRHLGFGLAVFFLVLSFIVKRLHGASSLEMWKSIKEEASVFWGLFLGIFAFWNGACALMAMLVLFAYYVLRRKMIALLICGSLFVIEAKFQATFFSGSLNSPVSFLWNFGFVSEDKSVLGVWKYLVMLLGISFLLAPLCFLSLSYLQKKIFVIVFLPLLWGMTLQITPDIYLNHKFILMSVLAYWPLYFSFLIKMWDLQYVWARLVCVVLCFFSLLTGFLDLPSLIRSNGRNSSIKLEKASPLQLWIEQNTKVEDVFLTFHYVLSPVLMAGRSVFYGWPYYAWSAGHDTVYRRDRLRLALRSHGNFRSEAIKSLGIDYVLWDEELRKDPELAGLEDALREHFELVYTESDQVKVYKFIKNGT